MAECHSSDVLETAAPSDILSDVAPAKAENSGKQSKESKRLEDPKRLIPGALLKVRSFSADLPMRIRGIPLSPAVLTHGEANSPIS
jgi:hypothetical protein